MLTFFASTARRLAMDRWPLIGPSVRHVGRVLNASRYAQTGLDAVVDGEATVRLSPLAFSGGRYAFDPALTGELRRLAAPGRHLIDAGAHVGIASLLYATFAGPGARIVSFEPNSVVYETLVENARVNSWRIEPFRMALGDHVGEVSFFNEGANPNASLSADAPGKYWYWEGRSDVPLMKESEVVMTTIDAICEAIGLRPGLIKLDVEGAELQVLRGAAETLRCCRPVILMETHVFAWPSFGYSRDDLYSFIHELRYRVLDSYAQPLSRPLGEGPQRDNNHFILEPE